MARKRPILAQIRQKFYRTHIIKNCILCGRQSEVTHHILERSNGGADSYCNFAALCGECHEQVHDTDDPFIIATLFEKKAKAELTVLAFTSINLGNQEVIDLLSELIGKDAYKRFLNREKGKRGCLI
jgi:hypothetical protein